MPTPLPARRALTVGVVDPVPLYREGIAAVLTRTPWARTVGHTVSVAGARQLLAHARPDVLVLDSELAADPTVVRELIRLLPGLVVVLVTRRAQQTAAWLGAALDAGARSAVPRSAEPARLAEAIRQAAHNPAERYLDPELAAVAAAPRSRPASARLRSASCRLVKATLSRREQQVLRMVAEGMGNAEIARQLRLSVDTIRTHMRNVMRKLSARDRTHAATIAFRTGLLALSPIHELVPPSLEDTHTIVAS